VRPLPRLALVWTFLRSFLVQSSWNYHTMLGTGFAFSMLPTLKRLFGADEEELNSALERHVDHFNAHPYLANIALGAALRMEADGEQPETIRRFKLAVRGPLGGLGDSLFWASWLPLVSILSIALGWAGLLPRWGVVTLFLVLYNLGHLGVRIWGYREGLRLGRSVGHSLARLDMSGWSDRLRGWASLVLGVLAALVLTGRGGLVEAGWIWGALGTVAFTTGLWVGHRAWRPAAALAVVAIGLISIWGVVR